MNYILFKSRHIKVKSRKIKSHRSERLRRTDGEAHTPFICYFQNCNYETSEETQTCRRSKPCSWLSERVAPGHPLQALRPAGPQAKHPCSSLILQPGAPVQREASWEGGPLCLGLVGLCQPRRLAAAVLSTAFSRSQEHWQLQCEMAGAAV